MLSAHPVVLPASVVEFGILEDAGIIRGASEGIWNTESVGVLLDKIVFFTRAGVNQGIDFRVQMRYRNEPITNGLVRLGGIAYPQNTLMEVSQIGGSLEATAGGTAVVKLARPMYLAPGERIEVAIQNAATGEPVASIFQAVGIGRQAAAAPVERWLPYLATYETPDVSQLASDLVSVASTPQDLGNPFATPLEVERIIGRVLGGVLPAQAFKDVSAYPPEDGFQIRISDAQDQFWISAFAPMTAAFNRVDRSWVVGHTLPAHAYLRAEFEITPGWSTAVTSASYARAVLGLVGYRRIG